MLRGLLRAAAVGVLGVLLAAIVLALAVPLIVAGAGLLILISPVLVLGYIINRLLGRKQPIATVNVPTAEEIEMMQLFHRSLVRMEERVETLETILMGVQKEGRKDVA